MFYSSRSIVKRNEIKHLTHFSLLYFWCFLLCFRSAERNFCALGRLRTRFAIHFYLKIFLLWFSVFNYIDLFDFCNSFVIVDVVLQLGWFGCSGREFWGPFLGAIFDFGRIFSFFKEIFPISSFSSTQF